MENKVDCGKHIVRKEISTQDIRIMLEDNIMAKKYNMSMTQETKQGASFFKDDGRPGWPKFDNPSVAISAECLIRDMHTNGFLMQYPHGKVIRQADTNFFYRGESQQYATTQASLIRKANLCATETERQVCKFVKDMRIGEFKAFVDRLEPVHVWPDNGIDVLYEPLAQHYGLDTEWLDITSDFEVALFFANCIWDVHNYQWRPLTKSDTEKDERRRYGVIFRRSYQMDRLIGMSAFAPLEGEKINLILPIGYQPFRRCNSQSAYGIKMRWDYQLQEDASFEQLYFRHDEAMARYIFESFLYTNK